MEKAYIGSSMACWVGIICSQIWAATGNWALSIVWIVFTVFMLFRAIKDCE